MGEGQKGLMLACGQRAKLAELVPNGQRFRLGVTVNAPGLTIDIACFGLEKLDHLSGRIVDNCSFFALDDLHDVSEEALYDRLLNEFPSWLDQAHSQGILT